MSHVLRVGVADQIAYFRAYNTDGSANTSLTASTTGLTLSVFRVGASSVSIASLSNKAADNTAHADGAIRNVGGNLYTIDLPDAACANQCPSICVRGSYTGGVIEGLEHPIVAYDPSVVAVGANTTTPPTAAEIEAALVNDGDATALLQAIADKIAGDLTAGDLTALAIVSAIKADATLAQMISRIDAQITSRPTLAAIESSTILAKEATVTARPTLASIEASTVIAKESSLTSIAANVTTLLNRITTGVAAMFGDLITMITGGGTANARWSTKALENVATGSVYVLPTKGTQQDRRVSKDEIEIYKTEGYTLVRTVTDAVGANVDLSGKTLELIIEGENRNDKAVIPDADIDISGTGNATYTVEIPTTVSAKADKTYNFYLWDKTNAARPKLLDKGRFVVEYAGTSGTT
jgi:hypothetical protein